MWMKIYHTNVCFYQTMQNYTLRFCVSSKELLGILCTSFSLLYSSYRKSSREFSILERLWCACNSFPSDIHFRVSPTLLWIKSYIFPKFSPHLLMFQFQFTKESGQLTFLEEWKCVLSFPLQLHIQNDWRVPHVQVLHYDTMTVDSECYTLQYCITLQCKNKIITINNAFRYSF